ncbi:hypothetical protein HK101_007576 [Irineochytrium annulatum]|nr:hypothetical protein HK101_007576 [Irineochytrium annulatum]
MTNTKLQFFDIASQQQPHTWNPNTVKTRLALNYKQIDHDTTFLSYPDIAPTLTALGATANKGFGKSYTLPAIEHDGKCMMDSYPIAVHLDVAFPGSPSLFPTPESRVTAHLVQAALDAKIFPLARRLVLYRVPAMLDERGGEYFAEDRAKMLGKRLEELVEDPERDWKAMEVEMAALGKLWCVNEGPFLAGEVVTYADFVMMSALVFFVRMGEDKVLKMGPDGCFARSTISDVGIDTVFTHTPRCMSSRQVSPITNETTMNKNDPASETVEYDGGPAVDWTRAGKLKVQALSGEYIQLGDLWAGGRRVIFVFLRRFGCQTCFSYIILFAHLRPMLANTNTRVVFITCHEDLSEIQTFLNNFAFWLRTLNNGEVGATGDKFEEASGGALPGELYMDKGRDVYRAFGITPSVDRAQLARIGIWTKFMVAFGLVDNVKEPKGGFKGAHKESYKAILRVWLKVAKRHTDLEIWKQSPGIVVLDNEKLLYRFVLKDQLKPIPDINDPNLQGALMCEKPDLELLDEAVTKGLEKFIKTVQNPANFGKVEDNELPRKQKLGSGRESEVFKSKWMGVEVAVKYFRYADAKGDDPEAEDPVQSFSNECAILMSLHHRNVITMMGFGCKPPNSYYLITEFMTRGSLFDVIGNISIPMEPERKKAILLDTARGMAFLHGCRPRVIHQDLKSLNLLIAEDWTVKVADFGIAKAKLENSQSNVRNAEEVAEEEDGTPLQGGTIQWMPPEQLDGSPRTTTKMDVFAFGVIMWEVGMRKRPWRGVPIKTICDNVIQGKRLSYPTTWEQPFQKLMSKCWAQDANTRPPFPIIVKSLEKMRVPATM